jgi:hypothetical protein
MNIKNNNIADLLNSLRETLPESQRDKLPHVTDTASIREWGSIMQGDASIQNEFLGNLQNLYIKPYLIQKSFKNPFAVLKKGTAEGGTIEEVAFNLIKAREFNPHKGAEREFQRNLPDVRSSFHTTNVSIQYPLTEQDFYPRRIFVSFEAVGVFIQTALQTAYTSAEHDEYLMLKYLLIKSVCRGRLHAIATDGTPKGLVKKARTLAQQLPFYSTKHNQAGMHTFTKPENLYLFMTAEQIADLDVEVLAAAFNMEKTEFLGHVLTMPDFDEFDNDRFSEIKGGQFEPVTTEELELMKKVSALLFDNEWVQWYDVIRTTTSNYNASGSYKNYFYTVEMILSTSPFSNAIALTKEEIANPENLVYVVDTVAQKGENIVQVSLTPKEKVSIHRDRVIFLQNESANENGTIVQPYGNITFSKAGNQKLEVSLNGQVYSAQVDGSKLKVGSEITLAK